MRKLTSCFPVVSHLFFDCIPPVFRLHPTCFLSQHSPDLIRIHLTLSASCRFLFCQRNSTGERPKARRQYLPKKERLGNPRSLSLPKSTALKFLSSAITVAFFILSLYHLFLLPEVPSCSRSPTFLVYADKVKQISLFSQEGTKK